MLEARERRRRFACRDLLRRLRLEEGARVEAEGGAHVGRVVRAAASLTPKRERQEAADDGEHEQEPLRALAGNSIGRGGELVVLRPVRISRFAGRDLQLWLAGCTAVAVAGGWAIGHL